MFSQVPRGHWDDISNQRAFMDELAKKLNIHDKEDWYKVSVKMVKQCGGAGVLSKYKDSVIELITSVYKEYPIIDNSCSCDNTFMGHF